LSVNVNDHTYFSESFLKSVGYYEQLRNSDKLEVVAHWRMTTKMKGLFIASHPVLP